MFIAPPFDPLHAHTCLAHVGPDMDRDYMWNLKNSVCAQAGEDDLTRWGTGRFHMERDEANSLFGHAPQEERLVV